MVWRDLPGRFLTSPSLADDVSSPSSSYPSAGCSSAEPASVSLDKIRAFPVSVSLRVYRAGNGQREFELVASGVTDDFATGGEFRQGRADSGRANTTKLLQLLNRGRFLELGQGLTHPLGWCGWNVRLSRGSFHYR